MIRDEGASVGEVYGQMQEANGPHFLSAYARAVSNGPLRFHTDRTDVVGLLCIDQAVSGGLSKIASTVAIHNEILRRRPDLLEELFRPYPRSRLGEEKNGGELFYMLPVFGLRDGRFTSHYSRTYIEAAQKLPHVPRLTDRQMEAMDLLAEVAESLCYRMHFQPGDMQFLNNHVIYHARDAFADDVAAGRMRRLCGCGWRCPTAAPCRKITRCCGAILRRAPYAAASGFHESRSGINPRQRLLWECACLFFDRESWR